MRRRPPSSRSAAYDETSKSISLIEFRPFLLATTSFDGSLSTTFGRKVTNVVCHVH